MERFLSRLRHISVAGMRARVYCEDFLLPKLLRTAADLWSVYSKPVPANSRELWTLFLQCSCVTVVVGGLFYNWMFASLEYSWHFSISVAISFSFLLLLTLFLVHPARCVFSMIMPTLGTKQGRKLLLSTCIMIVVVNLTPNIISNIKIILQVIQCICKNSSESLLNSTAVLLGTASWEFGDAVQETGHSINIFEPMNGHFLFSLLQNSSLIHQQMHLAGEKIGRDFLAVEVLVKDSVRVGNKLVAGFSMLYLCFESTWYLKNYLTKLCFDNFYITEKLERLAVDRKASHLLVDSSKNLIRPTSLRLSREEVILCLVQAMLLTVALMLVLVVVVMDHFAFSVADTVVRKVADFSVVPVALNIKYSAKMQILPFLLKLFPFPHEELALQGFERSYHHHLTSSSAHCRISPPTPPNPSVLLVVGLLFCILYATVFLETYAHRLCRKIAGSFFESWEEKRALYLYNKLSRKHKEEQNSEKLRVLLEMQGMPETSVSGWRPASAVGSCI